jgi:hypothetical protein
VAERLGAPLALINFEALLDDNAARAVLAVPEQAEPALGVYRGWMLRPAQYARLDAALLERNVRLINDPAAYQYCHELPAWYPQLAHWTPRTAWLPIKAGAEAPTTAQLRTLLAPFGDHPLILKDYVKSRKHEWLEACFIPSAADLDAVKRVVQRFIDLQGSDLAGGLVFREYVAFAAVGLHPHSAMPLTREYRIFWLDGEPLATAPYWAEGQYPDHTPPVAMFQPVAAQIGSRIFTMDIAQRTDDGQWQVIELGDGQVAGLPERLDVDRFYVALAEALKRSGESDDSSRA